MALDLQYVYQKKRGDFGRQCLFSDRGPELIDNFPSNKAYLREYILRDPVSEGMQCTPVMGSHIINTDRAEYTCSGINHVEGGWPKDLNMNDEEQTKRYRRKIEKDEGYTHTLSQLLKSMENCILQNNAINIYQLYFSDVEPTPLVDKSTARTVNVYQDQAIVTRPVSHISWSPDNNTKLAISHCNMKFQANVPNETTHSYIWEVENPNRPLYVLQPPTPIVCLEYNPKDVNNLASGQFNGQIAIWDLRRGTEPVEYTIIENSHRDPVRNVLWINSKSGTEFVSSSTDGQCKWWDTRKLSEATETLILDPVKDEEQSLSNAMGASVLEYEPTIPTRFMVGTEHGIVISGNRKGKTALEKMIGRFHSHLGPVLALQRNPGFVKNFLTVGDWTAKIWAEDCRESAIMWTNYHKAMINDGAWSPTRFSVFFTARSDGILDAWDVLQQQKQACVGVKVCDEPLQCVRTHDAGRIIATGNEKGTTYLVELSENLSLMSKNDKLLLTAMFDRENRREKILEARNREIRLKQKAKSAPSLVPPEGEAIPEEKPPSEVLFRDPQVIQAEKEYFLCIENELHPPEEMPEEEEERDDDFRNLQFDSEPDISPPEGETGTRPPSRRPSKTLTAEAGVGEEVGKAVKGKKGKGKKKKGEKKAKEGGEEEKPKKEKKEKGKKGKKKKGGESELTEDTDKQEGPKEEVKEEAKEEKPEKKEKKKKGGKKKKEVVEEVAVETAKPVEGEGEKIKEEEEEA